MIVILTGAGISQESGLSTFRDAGGLWDTMRIEDVATPGGFRRNPDLVYEFYNTRRRQLRDVQPNAAHKALAELEQKSGEPVLVSPRTWTTCMSAPAPGICCTCTGNCYRPVA